MIIVAGAIFVDPAAREDYLAGCHTVLQAARSAPGCLDFALSPDLLEPGRINVYERWASTEQLAAFRENGPDEEQQAQILDARVHEYEVSPS